MRDLTLISNPTWATGWTTLSCIQDLAGKLARLGNADVQGICSQSLVVDTLNEPSDALGILVFLLLPNRLGCAFD
jgi:hypothetical protein